MGYEIDIFTGDVSQCPEISVLGVLIREDRQPDVPTPRVPVVRYDQPAVLKPRLPLFRTVSRPDHFQ